MALLEQAWVVYLYRECQAPASSSSTPDPRYLGCYWTFHAWMIFWSRRLGEEVAAAVTDSTGCRYT
jgi:hypothetical protein